MADQFGLSEDQQHRIAATLQRISAGLELADDAAIFEPAHIFHPEAFDERQT